MSKISKECICCHRIFSVWPYRKHINFCSKKCYYTHKANSNIISKKCLSCEKVFTGPTYAIKHRKYCSYRCANLAYSKNHKKIIVKICAYCKKEFSNISKNRSINQIICCSPQCAGKLKETKISKICAYCGKEFSGFKGYIQKRKYCSNGCRGLAKEALRIPIIKCKICGKEFHRNEKRNVYCSTECGLRAIKCTHSKWSMELADMLWVNGFNIRSHNHGGEVKFKNINNRYYFVDILYKNKVIECFGNYWHAHESIINRSKNAFKKPYTEIHKRDNERIEFLKQSYKLNVLVVWEYDFYKDKDEVIRRCVEFLSEKI